MVGLMQVSWSNLATAFLFSFVFDLSRCSKRRAVSMHAVSSLLLTALKCARGYKIPRGSQRSEVFLCAWFLGWCFVEDLVSILC